MLTVPLLPVAKSPTSLKGDPEKCHDKRYELGRE